MFLHPGRSDENAGENGEVVLVLQAEVDRSLEAVYLGAEGVAADRDIHES